MQQCWPFHVTGPGFSKAEAGQLGGSNHETIIFCNTFEGIPTSPNFRKYMSVL
jgi:hypothetical protein